MIEYFTYLMYVSCWRLLRALPKSAAYRLGDVIADLTRLRNGKSIRRLHSNLLRVKPEYDKDQMANLLKKACDHICDTGLTLSDSQTGIRTIF